MRTGTSNPRARMCSPRARLSPRPVLTCALPTHAPCPRMRPGSWGGAGWHPTGRRTAGGRTAGACATGELAADGGAVMKTGGSVNFPVALPLRVLITFGRP